MAENKPDSPDLPKTLLKPLERQSPDRLDEVSAYARELARWKRAQREQELTEAQKRESISDDEQAELEARGISTDPAEYDTVPTSGAYITIKETKPGYEYYYWQWREGDSWKNEYIVPIDPKGTTG